ncbi:PhzF family phenazine biosynthesis protein [Pseudonocardia charpentierae]|uniref:PhzF family phenazine biosynthesis protein n=1 Tax=Pseudonocardia charpentierae TaxID=3075545 RepID=A0ABU2NEX3_9PSEU|nr:PhzF family phenazine biosynthesis protein [Pseudonocardia sp. DSM 45834]MDT0351779.1 PhzF family phenazine biosynthesis protein [Pseudonocardia sp. DSM 45834]
MGLHFDIVDVFTDRAYAGNPLAVVHRARTLTARQMQAIAAEFGLSETAFTLPPTTSAATYRLRIFTPARELPFAGHPSIGAAWALAFADMIRPGRVVQECGAGLLPVHVDASGARVVSGRPEVGPDLPGASLAATVGLGVDDLDTDLPAGVAAAGVPFAFLPVRPDAMVRAVPDLSAVATATADQTGLVVVAVDREKSTAHVRVFCPQVGVAEDPATGSAAVALGVFLGGRGVLADGPSVLRIAQGAEMGRPSALEVQVRIAGGVAAEVAVQGGVRMVAKGELLALPDA